MIRLVILDDDTRFSLGLKTELERFPDFESIVMFNSGLAYFQALQQRDEDCPDVVLMDISMSTPDEGIQLTALMQSEFPQVKVVILTISDADDMVFEAIKAGAVGYLLKDEKPEFIVKTIHDVFHGGAQMSPSIARKTLRFLSQSERSGVLPVKTLAAQQKLSQRESEILELIAQGFTYKLIADKLFISFETVKKHMSNIYQKLAVNNKIDAIRKRDGYL